MSLWVVVVALEVLGLLVRCWYELGVGPTLRWEAVHELHLHLRFASRVCIARICTRLGEVLARAERLRWLRGEQSHWLTHRMLRLGCAVSVLR